MDDAKATFLRSASAKTRSDLSRSLILGSELSALRIDVKLGKAEQVLPEIESRLQEVRAWWQRQRAGESVPEAPDPVRLMRNLISSLDVLYTANHALSRWDACLGVLTEIGDIQGALGEGQNALARTRFNWYFPLLRLGRLEEAEAVLENSLDIFRGTGDLPGEAKVFSALADLWAERGDYAQAVGLESQALTMRNRLSSLEDRSMSHGNLANYLECQGNRGQAARNRLARVSYDLVMDHGEHLANARRNLAGSMLHAAASGNRYELPRLAELLSRPEFEPLRQTLTEWNVELGELQGKIDEVVEEVRRGVEDGGG